MKVMVSIATSCGMDGEVGLPLRIARRFEPMGFCCEFRLGSAESLRGFMGLDADELAARWQIMAEGALMGEGKTILVIAEPANHWLEENEGALEWVEKLCDAWIRLEGAPWDGMCKGSVMHASAFGMDQTWRARDFGQVEQWIASCVESLGLTGSSVDSVWLDSDRRAGRL